jgi:hypothetical protein
MDATIVKRSLRPGAPGTRRLALLHGRDLVCVRYRETTDGSMRLTTVELVVERRMAPGCLVRVAVDGWEKALQAELKARGARWNSELACWLTTLNVARSLKLQDRILGVHAGAARRGLTASRTHR